MTPAQLRARRGAWLALAVLPLVVLVPVAWLVVRCGFDGLYGQDAYAYFDYALGPLRDNMLTLKPPPPFVWPPGYPLLVALASLPLGPVPAAAQAVSLLAGALVPVFTALFAFEVCQPSAATEHEASDPLDASPFTFHLSRFTFAAVPLLAGLLAALTGQLWQSAAVAMSDTASLLAATVGMWALARYGRSRQAGLGWLLLASGALAFAVLTRWAYALVAFPATAYALLALARRGRPAFIRHSLAAAAVVAIVLAPLWTAALRTALEPAGAATPFTVDLQVYSWSPLNALRREFVTADGVLRYNTANGLWYALAPAHRFYFTPLIALFIVPGLWAILQRDRRSAASLLLVVGWAAVIVLFHAGAPWQNFRFNLAHLPPLAILAALGIATVAGWLQRRLANVRLRQLALAALAVAVLVGLAWMARGGWRLTESFAVRKSADLATVRWVEAQTPAGARLLTFGLTATFQHESDLETHELWSLAPGTLAALLADGRPAFLLLDVANVESQWQGHSPAENYHWLRDNRGLAEIGAQRAYTLFAVGPREPGAG